MEKLQPENNISRRGFLKVCKTAVEASFLTALGGDKLLEVAKYILERRAEELIHDLKTLKIVYPTKDIPPELRGFYANMVFTYMNDDKNKRLDLIGKAKDLGSTRARISIRDADFEEELGKYDLTVLEKIKTFAGELEENGMGIEIDLFDCFFYGNGAVPTPSYPAAKITSPYNRTKTLASYKDFFTDKNLKDHYKNRMVAIMTGLKKRGVKNIVWVPINEAFPELIDPDDPENGKRILTEWYQEIVKEMREIDRDSPIISGVKDPGDIDYSKIYGLTANTAHIYSDFYFNDIKKNLFNNNDPIVIQEFGTPYRFNSLDIHKSELYEVLSLSLVLDILDMSIKKQKGVLTGEEFLYCRISSFGGWKIADHDDSFSFLDPFLRGILFRVIQALEIFRKKQEQQKVVFQAAII